MHIGEPVRLLDGGTATVVSLHALPGVGPMWDLSLDATHTFAVGDVQAVVHNCPVGGGDTTIYEKNASHIFRDSEGHFTEDTPENRQQLIDVTSERGNLQGTDIHGYDVYAKINPDGSQTWAYVRNGTEIRNGGLNLPGRIRYMNPDTGLFDPYTP